MYEQALLQREIIAGFWDSERFVKEEVRMYLNLKHMTPHARQAIYHAAGVAEDDEVSKSDVMEHVETAARAANVLRNSSPYYMGAEVIGLIDTASQTLPAETSFRASDLPTPLGFMWLEKPLRILSSNFVGREVIAHMVGIVWCIVDDGVQILSCTQMDHQPFVQPALIYYYKFGEPFLREHYAEVYSTFEDKASNVAFRFVASMLAFLSQNILKRGVEQPNRIARKQLAKLNRTAEPVNYIYLRKVKVEKHDAATGEPIEWSCRWIVQGHWRKQPYGPRVEPHYKSVWIVPFVKGPDDKPLKAPSGRIFAVVR